MLVTATDALVCFVVWVVVTPLLACHLRTTDKAFD